MPVVLLLIAGVLTAAAADAVVESVIDRGETIVALGGAVNVATTTDTTLTILTILSATAALAWVAAIAFARGRRLERRMAAELDERWDAQSRHNAGVEGRNKLLEYRVAELQTKLDELSGKRDALVDEIRAVRKRTSELQNIAHEQRETIIRLTGGAISDEAVVVVPELDDDLLGDASAPAEGPGAVAQGASADEGQPVDATSEADGRPLDVADELDRLGF